MTGDSTTASNMTKPRITRRWLYAFLWFLLTLTLLFLGAIYAVKNWLLPDLTVLQPRIESALSSALKQPVRVQGLGAQWNWASADVHLDRISIGAPDAPVLQASGVKATVLAYPLLWGSVQTSGDGLSIASLTLAATQTGTKTAPIWQVAGLDMAKPSDGAGLRWALAQPSLSVASLNVNMQDVAKYWVPEGKTILMLSDVGLTSSGLGTRSHSATAQFAPTFDDMRLGRNARFDAQFSYGLLGDAAVFKQWTGQASLDLPNVHIARSVSWLLPLAKNIPNMTLQQWQTWAQRSAADAQLDSKTVVQFDAGKLTASGKLQLSRFSKNATSDPSGGVTPVSWSWKPAHGSGNLTIKDAAHMLQLGTDKMRLEPLLQWLRGAPLGATIQEAITQAQLHGTLTKVLIDAVLDDQGLQSATVNTQLDQLGLRSVDIAGKKGTVNIPTIDGISGAIKVEHSREQTITQIRLASQQAYADLPRLLAQPRVVLDRLTGDIEVVLKPAHIALQFKQLRFSNPDAAGELNGGYEVATDSTARGASDKDSLGVAKITGQFTRANLAQLHQYMPISLSDNARNWLRHTIAKGAASDLQFTLFGDLSRFPFLPATAQAGERFDLQTQIMQAVLNFNPLQASNPSANTDASTNTYRSGVQEDRNQAGGNKPWPTIEQVTGQLRLNGLAMTLLNMEGVAAGIPLRVPKLSIANLTQPVVVFQTRASANAQSVLNLIRSTPLSQRLGEQFDTLKATGNLSVDANLTLDIANPANNVHQATLIADQASLDFSRDYPPFERINAQLNIVQNNMRVEQATAFWLGGLVQLTGELNTQDPSKSLRAQATAQLADVKQAWPHPMAQALLKHAQGHLDYALDLSFQPDGVAWKVVADLKNTALLWPGLLDKSAGVPLPFSLSRTPTQRQATTSDVTRSERTAISQDLWETTLGASVLGPFRATIERQLQGEQWRVLRGALALGEAAELNAPDQGLGIHIATPKVNLDQLRQEIESLPWATLPSLETKPAEQGAAAVSPRASQPIPTWMPSVLALQVDDLTLAARRFYNVVGAAVRDTSPDVKGQNWRGNLVAKGINGYFSWADASKRSGLGGGALLMQLTELTVPSAEVEQTSKTLLKLSPEQVPSLDIRIDRLTVGDKNLGAAVVKARNQGGNAASPAWTIDALSLTTPQASLSATGQWVQAASAPNGAGQVNLDLAFKTDSLGDTLSSFGHGQLLAETAGSLEGKVQWSGTPFQMNIPSLSGQLTASFDKGRFLKIDPGAGKLVGLFSLQNLPRRLTLDFKDTFSDGFAFNAIKTSATITQGVMTLDAFDMASTVAGVKAAGQVSLVDETQNLIFTVKPDINAGSVSLLYMIVNPPLGLATLAAQFLLREPISKAFTLEYAITGAWAKPEVKQLKRAIQ